jgi:hypothetical protein
METALVDLGPGETSNAEISFSIEAVKRQNDSVPTS